VLGFRLTARISKKAQVSPARALRTRRVGAPSRCEELNQEFDALHVEVGKKEIERRITNGHLEALSSRNGAVPQQLPDEILSLSSRPIT
jgi:hypothetical protein